MLWLAISFKGRSRAIVIISHYYKHTPLPGPNWGLVHLFFVNPTQCRQNILCCNNLVRYKLFTFHQPSAAPCAGGQCDGARQPGPGGRRGGAGVHRPSPCSAALRCSAVSEADAGRAIRSASTAYFYKYKVCA
jgi:hypothetical protein